MTSAAIALLRDPRTIRERSRHVLAAVQDRRSAHFTIHEDRLAHAAQIVAEVTRSRYPDLKIPYHSRWRHFEAGGRDRHASLAQALSRLPCVERARSEIDLAVVSVLLDAGAGPQWSYFESDSGQRLSRSEGLGVAAWHAFVAGEFSSLPDQPLRVDAERLARIDEASVRRIFQVAPGNELVGASGRAELMRRLARALADHPELFGTDGRPGGLFDTLADGSSLPAEEILAALLTGLSTIWPSGNQLDGESLGDCWPHRFAGGDGPSAGWVPFHKLSQWMTYSLLEPFERAGIAVIELDRLTALAEYRNGGLMIDTGVIAPIDPTLAQQPLTPAAEPIIEWRALTIALMDPLADQVRRALGLDACRLPLAKILEGGTWAAGRVLASRLRGGSPPLTIVSDGTVF